MPGKFELAAQFAEVYPQEAARILEELVPAYSSVFIDAVPDGQSLGILSSMLPYHAAKCVALLTTGAAAKYLGNLDPKVAANIFRHIPKESADAILEALPRRSAVRISLILDYSPSMVGAWLEPNVLTLPSDCSVGEAKKRLANEQYADFHRIYVVDDSHNLKGLVRLASLFGADDANSLEKYLQPFPSTLRASTSLDSALSHPAWSNSDYLPVVDRRRRFLGVLRFAVLRTANSKPQTAKPEENVAATILDLAETCYIGLAEAMSASLALDSAPDAARRK